MVVRRAAPPPSAAAAQPLHCLRVTHCSGPVQCRARATRALRRKARAGRCADARGRARSGRPSARAWGPATAAPATWAASRRAPRSCWASTSPTTVPAPLCGACPAPCCTRAGRCLDARWPVLGRALAGAKLKLLRNRAFCICLCSSETGAALRDRRPGGAAARDRCQRVAAGRAGARACLFGWPAGTRAVHAGGERCCRIRISSDCFIWPWQRARVCLGCALRRAASCRAA